MSASSPEKLSQAGRLGFLLKDTLLYGVAQAISKFGLLVAFAFLARHFQTGDYGALDYYITLATFLMILCTFGQDSAIARYFHEYDAIESRAQLISQSLFALLFFFVLLLSVLFLTVDFFSHLLPTTKESNAKTLFAITLVQVPFLVVLNICQNILKWSFARKRFLILSLGYTIFQTITLLIFVGFPNQNATLLLTSLTIPNAIFSLLGFYFIKDWIRPIRDFAYFKNTFAYAWPYGVICTAGAALSTLDKNLTEFLLGADQLGFYAIATKIAAIIAMFNGSFQSAWGPFSLKIAKSDGSGLTFNLTLKLFTIAVCSLVLVFNVFGEFIIGIFGSERYVGATVVLFPLLMAAAIQGISWITESGIDFSMKSHLRLYATIPSLIGLLIFCMVLTPFFGLLGIGLSVLLVQIVRSLISSTLAQMYFPVTWDYFRPLAFLTVITSSGIFSSIIRHQGDASLARFIESGTCFIFILCCFFVFSKPELNLIKSIILKNEQKV